VDVRLDDVSGIDFHLARTYADLTVLGPPSRHALPLSTTTMASWPSDFSWVSPKHPSTPVPSTCCPCSTLDERSLRESPSCTVSRSIPPVAICSHYTGANIIATAVAGLISAATFATLGGVHGLEGWRWLFIILGVVTFGIAIIAIFVLPDHPLTTRWLSEDQRQLAHERMERDTVGLEESRGSWVGLQQAAKDPKLWALTLLQTLHLAACGFNSFFPTVVRTLGYSKTLTLVLTCPPYLVAGIFSVALAWHSGRKNERSWHITLGMIVALVGFIMAAASLNTGVRFVSLFLFATGSYSANSIIIGWVAATCGQTQEKKAGALSIMNCIAMASFIYTPYLYPASDGPRYLMAMSANAAFVTGVIILTWIMRTWLCRINNKMRREDANTKLLFAY